VNSSGYYAWKKQPLSDKLPDDPRLLGLLKQAWRESGCDYGYRKLTLHIRYLGERYDKHLVARLLRNKDNSLLNSGWPWLHNVFTSATLVNC
jgi:putative transposase